MNYRALLFFSLFIVGCGTHSDDGGPWVHYQSYGDRTFFININHDGNYSITKPDEINTSTMNGFVSSTTEEFILSSSQTSRFSKLIMEEKYASYEVDSTFPSSDEFHTYIYLKDSSTGAVLELYLDHDKELSRETQLLVEEIEKLNQ